MKRPWAVTEGKLRMGNFLRWERRKKNKQHYLYVDGKEQVVKEKLNDAGDGSQVFD